MGHQTPGLQCGHGGGLGLGQDVSPTLALIFLSQVRDLTPPQEASAPWCSSESQGPRADKKEDDPPGPGTRKLKSAA